MEVNELTREVIGAAMEVHRFPGPGLLESVYESCLCVELDYRSIPFGRQKEFPIEYRERKLDCGYRLDLVVGANVSSWNSNPVTPSFAYMKRSY